ncbi:TPR-like protein [Pholiota conissans]|uniref:TPR-like protein n=1 Tax=Pholiota conissans TaxID=109636 RepID=A0A9P6CRP2_9AGAR|nr:TPR-like protein [Pholiota conissans]
MSSNELMRPDNPAESSQVSASAVDTSIQFTNTVLAVVKEVGEMLNGVPYVKSLSGVVLQIIKIRDELKVNKKRCVEIIDKVMRMAKKIFEKLAEVAKSDQRDKLAKLEEQLKEHERTLIDVHTALKKHQSRSGFDRLINRGLEELNEHDRRLDELKTDLILDVIFHITMEQASTTITPAQPQANSETFDNIDHVLPPKPHFLVERDAEVDQAVEILLRQEPTRIAILGGGGFGKTTLARTILHDSRIVERFQVRYFLSCEGMSDADALLLGLGAMLGIKEITSKIISSARRILQTSTTLLCLDNFETPWESFETRTKVEELLESISDIPNLSLLITIRGEQRPSKVAWSKPLLLPLSTLSLEGAQAIVTNIVSKDTIDDFTNEILEAIDGIPLAITLVATLLRDGEDSKSLWTRWCMDSTQAINVGDDRQSNLDRSITLSVNSSRMTKNPETRILLVALSLLPDGFPNDDALESLQECLSVSSIHALLQTLRKVALVQIVNTDSSPRIQMLSPIRLFCHHFLAQEIVHTLPKTIDHYVNLLLAVGYTPENSVNYQKITNEVRNIHTIFQKMILAGFENNDPAKFIKAFDCLTSWSIHIGYYSQHTLQIALECSKSDPVLHAHWLLSIADLYHWEANFTDAVEYFQKAADIFEQENSAIMQANALGRLGDTLLQICEYDKAEEALKKSRALCIAENNSQGQAFMDFNLGRICLDQERFQEANEYLVGALMAYKQIEDLVGLANTTKNMCRLHMRFENLSEAEIFANLSLAISQEANYAIGEGGAQHQLGQIYIKMDKIAKACKALEKAFSVFKHQRGIGAQLAGANDLAKVYIQMDRLSVAEKLLEPYSRTDTDIIFLGHVLATFGWLYICGGRFDKAERHLNAALQHFRRYNDPSGQASVLAHLALVYFKTNQLDKAERAVHSISELGHWRGVDMFRLWVLGDLHIIKGQFDDAQAMLNSAMVDAEDDHRSYQQGNIARSLGNLHIKHNAIDLAIEKFKEALELHRKAQWVSEQATDLKRLGEAYKMSERSEEAKETFKEAEELMDSVREARQLSD